jgi:ketosteroid isomerase-like protein
MRQGALNYAICRRFWIVLAIALMAVTIPAAAQKKNKNKNTPTSDSGADTLAAIPVPDSQAIDRVIGEFLGYWQIGDTESMHKYSADNVVVVSGAWEPPVIGWDNYLKAYQAQRARVTGTQLERSNTFIKVAGSCAWATYQFVYAAQMDGKPVQYFGHTTLILMKQADRWVITMNHSSVVDSASPQPAAPMSAAPPVGKP